MVCKKMSFMIFMCFFLMFFPSFSSAESLSVGYKETTESFDNPERGFYVPVFLKLRETDTSIPYDQLNHPLIHLRVDISDFGDSGRKISASALASLDQTLGSIKENGGTAIIRFAYDSYFAGKTVLEPGLKMMKTHMSQVSQVLKRHEPVILCVEAGMLGLYGEYHGTGSCTKKNRKSIIQAWLNDLPAKFMISVRTPGYIAEWAGISLQKLCAYGTSKQGIKRLGIYNDGYLGSSGDLGTYVNRDAELDWMDEQTDSTFFGGEMAAYIDKGAPKNTAKYMEKEGFLTHTSYLNSLWNDKAIARLKKEVFAGKDSLFRGLSGYEYVNAHLGYRFVLTDSDVSVSGDYLNVSFQIKNVGFGSMIKDKVSTLILESQDKIYEFPFSDFDIRVCKSQYRIKCKDFIHLENVEPGDYHVYLRISEYGDHTSDHNYHCVRFANTGSQWNALLGANRIGSVNMPGAVENPVAQEALDDQRLSHVSSLKVEDLNQRFKESKGIRYKLAGSKAKIIRVDDQKNVTIPERIVVNKKFYQVTGLNKRLFKDCKKMQTIKILNKTKKITSGTFRSCKKLKRITLSKTIKKIQKGSLPEKSLKKIIYPGKKSQFDKLKLTWLHRVKVSTSDQSFRLV